MAKFVCIFLALSAMVALASAACSSSVLSNLESQIQTCARNVPVQQYNDPRWRCARSVSGSLKRDSSCSLDAAPALLQSCLEGNSISASHVTPAVECIKNAIAYGICC